MWRKNIVLFKNHYLFSSLRPVKRLAILGIPAHVRYSFSTQEKEEDSHNDFKPQIKPKKEIDEKLRKEKIQFIEDILKQNKLVLFMKGSPDSPRCGYSNYVIQLLKHYKITTFKHVDILQDSVLREEVKKFAHWPTYPQLWVSEKLIGGSDILQEMHKDGSLGELLKNI